MNRVSTDTKVLAGILVLYTISTLVSMAGMEIFGWATALGAILMLVLKRRPLSALKSSVYLPVDFALLGLFVVVVLGAVFKTPDGISKVDVVGSARWILLIMFLRTALSFTWSDKFSKGFIVFLTALLTIISVYSVWQYFYGVDLIRGARHVLEPKDFRNGQPIFRAEGLFGSSMTFGNSIALSWCFPIAWLLYGNRKQWQYKLAAASSLIGILAIFATMTRGVWLSAVGALIVMSAKAHRRGLILLASVALIFFAISTVFLPELGARLQSIGDTTHGSNSARVQLWHANFEIFKENPILGVGYGVNEEIIGDYYARLGITDGFHGHAHNTYLQFLSGTGLLGFICFTIFMFYFMWINWQLSRDMARDSARGLGAHSQDEWPRIFVEGALGAQVALFVGGLTECNFKDAEVNHQFILILAVVATLYVRYRQTAARTPIV